MPRRGSLIKDFLVSALQIKKYPNLCWKDESQGIFVLSCIHKNNKDWKSELVNIFKDWHNEKTRKDDELTKMRQRFLQALKKCQFINKLKKDSSKTDFIYQFITCSKEKGETFSSESESTPSTEESFSCTNVQSPTLLNESSLIVAGSSSVSEGSFSIGFQDSTVSDELFSSVSGYPPLKNGSVLFDPGPPVYSESDIEKNILVDQTNLLPTGSNRESEYVNENENIDYATNLDFDSFFPDLINDSIAETSASTSEELPMSEQSMNGIEINKVIDNMAEITLPKDQFRTFLGNVKKSPSDECITLTVPSYCLNLDGQQQASLINNPNINC